MTPTSKITPGYWQARNLDPEGDSPTGDGWEIDGPPQPLGRGQFAKAADAHLAAASPELFTATQTLMELVQELATGPVNPEIQRAINQAQYALNKAMTGKDMDHGNQTSLI